MISLDFSTLQWILLFICAMFVGMSKVGVPGVSMIVVPVLAFIFGGKSSTGILLPMLIMADVFGVTYYHRHAQWKLLLKLLPWAFLGIGIALWVGEVVNDEQFKDIIAIAVFVCIGFLLWKNKDKSTLTDKWGFAALMGILGGFATMIGNVAGPIFAVYLLAMHLPKKSFIGTGAWFFIIINICKFPLHFIIWETINLKTLSFDLLMLPAIGLGAFIGIKAVKKIPEKSYRIFVILVTAISALLLLI